MPLCSGFAKHVNLFIVYHKPDMRTVVFFYEKYVFGRKNKTSSISTTHQKKKPTSNPDNIIMQIYFEEARLLLMNCNSLHSSASSQLGHLENI